jgi:hypothetical protein
MDQSCDAEVHPKLFEFIEREQTGCRPTRFQRRQVYYLPAKTFYELPAISRALSGQKAGARRPKALAAALRIGGTLSVYLKSAMTGLLCAGPAGQSWPMNIWLLPLTKCHFAQELTKRRCNWRSIVIRTRDKPWGDVGCRGCKGRTLSPRATLICRGSSASTVVRGKVEFDGMERVTTQTLLDVLEVPQRSRTAGTFRRLAKLMAELGWTAVRVRDLTRGGYKEQVRGYVRGCRALS